MYMSQIVYMTQTVKQYLNQTIPNKVLMFNGTSYDLVIPIQGSMNLIMQQYHIHVQLVLVEDISGQQCFKDGVCAVSQPVY